MSLWTLMLCSYLIFHNTASLSNPKMSYMEIAPYMPWCSPVSLNRKYHQVLHSLLPKSETSSPPKKINNNILTVLIKLAHYWLTSKIPRNFVIIPVSLWPPEDPTLKSDNDPESLCFCLIYCKNSLSYQLETKNSSTPPPPSSPFSLPCHP